MTRMQQEDYKFAEIQFIDGSLSGKLAGFDEILYYGSCPSCFRKIDDGVTYCSKCEKEVDEVNFDFKFILTMEKDHTLHNFTGFKRYLPDHEDLGLNFETKEEIVVTLNNAYNDQDATVTYIKELSTQNGEENYIIQSMAFN